MDTLSEYSYIWEKDKEKYVLLEDELGKSILFLDQQNIMFFLVEDDNLMQQIIKQMLNKGNKIYNSIETVQSEMLLRK